MASANTNLLCCVAVADVFSRVAAYNSSLCRALAHSLCNRSRAVIVIWYDLVPLHYSPSNLQDVVLLRHNSGNQIVPDVTGRSKWRQAHVGANKVDWSAFVGRKVLSRGATCLPGQEVLLRLHCVQIPCADRPVLRMRDCFAIAIKVPTLMSRPAATPIKDVVSRRDSS